MSRWRDRGPLLAVLVLLVPVAAAVFRRMIAVPPSDIGMHVGIIQEVARSGLLGALPAGSGAAGTLPPFQALAYPLFHVLTWVVAFGRTDTGRLLEAAVLVLTGAVVVRTWISFRVQRSPDDPGSGWGAALAAGALTLAMPLPNWWKFPEIYLGQITPNVWHNPTTIVSVPFAVLLFYLAMRSLLKPSFGTIAVVAGVSLVTALAKPSYLLAFFPVYAVSILVALWRKRGPRATIAAAGAMIGAAGLVAGFQYTVLFTGRGSMMSQGVEFAPMRTWSLYSPNPVASVLLSAAFPLACLLLFSRRGIWSDGPVRVAFATAVLAIAEFALFATRGIDATFANLVWTSYIAMFILFLACARWVYRHAPPGWSGVLAWSVLAAQAITGAAYLAHTFVAPIPFL